MELGNRLRARRQELGLSLRELAERVGLTASFLSQIERDLASPSIESLRKISNALEVPIFHFLVEPDAKSPVVRRGERALLKLPDSNLTYQLMTPDLNRKMEAFWPKGSPARKRSPYPCVKRPRSLFTSCRANWRSSWLRTFTCSAPATAPFRRSYAPPLSGTRRHDATLYLGHHPADLLEAVQGET